MHYTWSRHFNTWRTLSSKRFGQKLQTVLTVSLLIEKALLSSFFSVNFVNCLVQVVMDEPCAVHYVGILQARDASFPTSAQVYNYTGLGGLSSDFNGTINVTQAGIPFSSGQYSVSPARMYAWLISQVAHYKMESLSCDSVTVPCKAADCCKFA